MRQAQQAVKRYKSTTESNKQHNYNIYKHIYTSKKEEEDDLYKIFTQEEIKAVSYIRKNIGAPCIGSNCTSVPARVSVSERTTLKDI